MYPPVIPSFRNALTATLVVGLLLMIAVPAAALEPGIRSLDENVQNQSVQTEPSKDKASAANRRDIESLEVESELRLLADLRVHSPEELEGLLDRVDQMFTNGDIAALANPVVFLLHGEEARTLYKSNYGRHKRVVDLAAKLSAFDVIDVKVCEAWANRKGLDATGLQPFVDTVKYAPAEKKRLVKKEGYTYF